VLISCLAYSSTLKIEVKCFSETSLTFNGIHGVISQTIEFFMSTAVRTSNPKPEHDFGLNKIQEFSSSAKQNSMF
jgi:hypothetical protein